MSRWIESHGGEAVRDWRAEAPRLAEGCADAWHINIEEFLPGGSLSCVLAGTRADGAPVVLKLLAPWAVAAIASEARALGAWRGCGVVELLAHTPDRRVLLLSRVRPGRSLSASGDDAADCARVAPILRAVASAPLVSGLPDLVAVVHARFTRARVSRRAGARVTAHELDAAEYRGLELAETAPMRTSVHGDAQNKNLLLDRAGGLVAIDPEPGTGDPHFDAALWALTHRPGQGVRYRCTVLSRLLDLDEGRLWSWCLALAVAEVALDLPERALAQRRLLARVRASTG